ncbi:hypothetical protein CJJ09_003089 [Candidozyma auris]|nr:hypothetical protein CJJ09_003089 [[Candida] auris]
MTDKSVDSLVLDATPLITQSASALQQFASNFFTTPGVRAELKDEHSRNQLLLWGDRLVVRQPKQSSVDRVSSFAKLTGDFSVLSMNDIHIIALAYELEVEKAGKDELRRYPGERLTGQEEPEKPKRDYAPKERLEEVEEDDKPQEDDDGFQIVSKKKSRKPRKKWSPKEPEKPKDKEEVKATENTAEDVPEERDPAQDGENPNEELAEEYDEDDDDGDWITPDNLKDEILKDSNETVQDNKEVVTIPVALSTGDFACQNTSLQLGLKLMNPHSGKQIKRVRNYMYRCHACFTMTPMSKTGQPKHFCPKCGGNTLLRCAVSVDNETGKVTPHLKRNFQWIVRGQVYSMPSPLSKTNRRIKATGDTSTIKTFETGLWNPSFFEKIRKSTQKR